MGLSVPVIVHEGLTLYFYSMTVAASEKTDRFYVPTSNFGRCVDIIAPVSDTFLLYPIMYGIAYFSYICGIYMVQLVTWTLVSKSLSCKSHLD